MCTAAIRELELSASRARFARPAQLPSINGGFLMKVILGVLFASLLSISANAQDSPFRKELKRAGLTGTNMEVITSIVEIKPGDASGLHIHHGEESFYVLEGGTIELP